MTNDKYKNDSVTNDDTFIICLHETYMMCQLINLIAHQILLRNDP